MRGEQGIEMMWEKSVEELVSIWAYLSLNPKERRKLLEREDKIVRYKKPLTSQNRDTSGSLKRKKYKR